MRKCIAMNVTAPIQVAPKLQLARMFNGEIVPLAPDNFLMASSMEAHAKNRFQQQV